MTARFHRFWRLLVLQRFAHALGGFGRTAGLLITRELRFVLNLIRDAYSTVHAAFV